jgi:hypothetical protein
MMKENLLNMLNGVIEDQNVYKFENKDYQVCDSVSNICTYYKKDFIISELLMLSICMRKKTDTFIEDFFIKAILKDRALL